MNSRDVELEVRGQGSLADLASELNDLDRIVDVYAGDATSSATDSDERRPEAFSLPGVRLLVDGDRH